MDKLDINDNHLGQEQNASIKPSSLALEEVIAEIDRSIGEINTSEVDEDVKNHQIADSVETRLREYVLVILENKYFGLPLSNALEIGHRPDIAPLPNLPNWILGISNIRGEIISFVDLKEFLGIPSSGANRDRRFVIIYNQDMKVGIAVDKTPGLLSMDEEQIDNQKNPHQQEEIVHCLKGVLVSGENQINILDTDRLLSSLRVPEYEID